MPHRTFTDPNSIEARQCLLDRRTERAHPKRHRTAKRKSRFAAAKAKAAKLKAAVTLLAVRKHKAAVAAYWRGELMERPRTLWEKRGG